MVDAVVCVCILIAVYINLTSLPEINQGRVARGQLVKLESWYE